MKRNIFLTILYISLNFFVPNLLSQTNNKIGVKKIESIEEKKTMIDFDWNNIISALIGGLIGLSPNIINYCKKAKIKGKIISQYASHAPTPEGINGTVVFQKVSIYSENKNFFLKDIDVYIKLPNVNELQCKVWTWRSMTLPFDELNGLVSKALKIDMKDYLLHHTVLPKEESIVGYISFTFDVEISNRDFEYVRYVFTDYKKNKIELKIKKEEIMANKLVHDDSIWV